ncbi:MAG: PAS domain S-box protein [Terracidiphilus sp.]
MIASEESERWTRHTHDVLEHIGGLSLAMEQIESASSGFAMTDKESSLDNYGPSVLRAKEDEAAIRNLTADNPTEQLYCPVIEKLTIKMIEHADRVIDLRKSQGMAAAAAYAESEEDKTTKETFRAIANSMREEEMRLRAQRIEATERNLNRTKLILILGTCLGMLGAIVAARTVLTEIAERQLSEEVLQQSEEKYRMLLNGVNDYAILTLSPQGQVTGWSTSAERIKGYAAEEIIGHNFSCFFLPEDIKGGRPTEVLRLAAKSGLYEEVGMRVRKDGSKFLATIAFRPLKDATGNLRGFSEICHDLTEKTTSDERYRGLLEAAPDGMVVVNDAGVIVLLNAQVEKQFGYRDELTGQQVTNIIPNGFAERLISDGTRSATEALEQQIGSGIELTGLRKDGTEFSLEIMLSRLMSQDGILVTVAIRDITVRRDAERHLKQMEARYRGLLEAAPDGMVVVNETGVIVLLNAQAERQFGYHRDELLGQNVTNIIPEGFGARLATDALRTTAEALAQQIGTGIELHGRRKDASQFPIEIMLSPLESADGVLVTAAIRDISERKQLARQLRQSQKMEVVGQLTGGIAHDFNNLLTVIIGNLGLLEILFIDNEAAIKRVRTAQKAASRGADITRRLLAFSRNEDLKPTFVVLGDSIQNLIEMASRGLGLEIKITTEVDPSVPPVFVDRAALESALLNLVVNARDAMPRGGSIVISTLLQSLDKSHPAVKVGDLNEGCYVCVKVSDTGQGMSREALDRAFEPFFTTKPQGKGTGLGLSMVYGFVKQSGGIVRIYSEIGVGTTVSFYLPIVADNSNSIPTESAMCFARKLHGKALVVDNDLDIRELALAYLTEMGFATSQANDGENAFRIIQQDEGIDLMITDVIMSGAMNGVELGQRARAHCPNLEIIYSSGFSAEALAERSMQLFEGPFLRKPYQKAEFTAIVHRVMEGHSELSANRNNSNHGR